MDNVSIPFPEHANGLNVVLKKRSGAYDIHTCLRTLIGDGELPPDRVLAQHLAQTALTLLANVPDKKEGTGAVQLVLGMVTAGSTTLPTQ